MFGSLHFAPPKNVVVLVLFVFDVLRLCFPFVTFWCYNSCFSRSEGNVAPHPSKKKQNLVIITQLRIFIVVINHRGVRMCDCGVSQLKSPTYFRPITTGTELIRRMNGAESEAFAVTTPLLTKSDGSKFGKSESGNVWLDAERTSPYTFYQFWLNASDEDAEKQVRIFTVWDEARVKELIDEHRAEPHLRKLQKAIAEDITKRVHGEAHLENAQKASEVFFGKGEAGDLRKLSAPLIRDVFEGAPRGKVGLASIEAGMGVIDMLSESTGFLASKSEARRALKEGSVSVNRQKVNDSYVLSKEDLLFDTYILLQRGKKKYFLVEVE